MDLKIRDWKQLITLRDGEQKAGESLAKDITEAKYVLIGIEEDIGVRENSGFPGAKNNWTTTLKCLLNTQKNRFNKLDQLFIAGSLEFNESCTVEQIDTVVAETIRKFIELGKVPIVIGGGHNNAYGILKGVSEGKNKKIDVLNFDAHTDYRKLEHRHSGNGFSYAAANGYLGKYCVYGVHENYTPEYIFEEFDQNPNLDLYIVEDLIDDKQMLEKALQFIKSGQNGMEVDLDCISGMPSSAMTPSGFDFVDFRKYFRQSVLELHPLYLHICEGITDDSLPPYLQNQTGKSISYLITDFIKSFKSAQGE